MVRAYLAQLRKEWRDQRALVIAILAALPVLTVLAFWGFADRLVDASLPEGASVGLAVALLLFVLAVGGDAFASESRRGTLALLRRTPRGLLLAFVAKVTFVMLGGAAVLLWQALVLYGAWALWGRLFQPDLATILVEGRRLWIPVAVLGAWMLLASTWLKHGGMAVLLAPLLFASLVAPGVVWFRANPSVGAYLITDDDTLHAWLVFGLALLALLAAAWSFLRGRRVVGSAWSAVWRGLTVLLIVAGATYAWGAVKVDRLLTLEPGDAGVRTMRAYAGLGSEALFMQVCRQTDEGTVLSPSRTWVIDVETGAWHALDGSTLTLNVPVSPGAIDWPGSSRSVLEPTPYVVHYRQVAETSEATWLDGRDGAVVKVAAADAYTADVLDWIDDVGRATTWVRDGEGRRVWRRFRDGLTRREGDGPPPSVRLDGGGGGFAMAAAWGWLVYAPGKQRMLVDAATMEERLVDWRLGQQWAISPRHTLLCDRPRGEPVCWRVLDAVTGASRLAGAVPEKIMIPHGWDQRPVLCSAEVEGGRALVLWDPVDGTIDAPRWIGEEPRSVLGHWVVGRASDGRCALGLLTSKNEDYVLALYDPAVGTIRTVATSRHSFPWAIAIEPEGSLLVVEPPHRVVRVGPDPGAREVLFPR